MEDKIIILFDGECAMCNNYILFVAKNDSDDNFRFLSIQNKKIIELEKKKHMILKKIISLQSV